MLGAVEGLFEKVLEDAWLLDKLGEGDQPESHSHHPHDLADFRIVGWLVDWLDEVEEETLLLLDIATEHHLHAREGTLVRIAEPVYEEQWPGEEVEDVEFRRVFNVQERHDGVEDDEEDVQCPDDIGQKMIHISSTRPDGHISNVNKINSHVTMDCSHDNLVRDTRVDQVICRDCGRVLPEDHVPTDWWGGAPGSREDTWMEISAPVSACMTRLCADMRLCDSVCQESLRVAYEAKVSKRHLPTLSACIYIACQRLRLDRTEYEIQSGCGVTAKALGRAISRLRRAGIETRSYRQKDSDDVERMFPRLVSNTIHDLTPLHPGVTKQREILLQGMYQGWGEHWGKVWKTRKVTLNMCLAKCLLQALQNNHYTETPVPVKVKNIVKIVCGVKSL
jgi:hypothetical protein